MTSQRITKRDCALWLSRCKNYCCKIKSDLIGITRIYARIYACHLNAFSFFAFTVYIEKDITCISARKYAYSVNADLVGTGPLALGAKSS